MSRARWWHGALALALALLPALASATAPVGGGDPLQVGLAQLADGDYTPAVKSFVFLTMLSFVPAMMVGMTAFTRIIIVLAMVRHALGLQQTPPNSVLVTLAMFLTLFTMAPVIERVNTEALQPYIAQQVEAGSALELGYAPLREFMVRQTREKDLAAVLEMAGAPPPERIEDIQARHLVPAFMLSELRTAFQISFVIFLPFLLIDLVVAAILMALGMIMVPPITVSLPLKVLVFLLVDGWLLISQALLGSFSG
jgi:flagellar biosynthetic protein FliP